MVVSLFMYISLYFILMDSGYSWNSTSIVNAHIENQWSKLPS